jgi:hypothetical protein
MMTATPIIEAEEVIITAIRNALVPLVGTYNSRPKVYWWRAEQGAALPYIVFQPQAPFGRRDWIDDVGGTALIAVKATANDPRTARALLEAVEPKMGDLSYAGYAIKAHYVNSPPLPPADDTWQSAGVYRITIERS